MTTIIEPGPRTHTFNGESLVRDGEIIARGVPVESLIGSMSYPDMLFFQLQARTPTSAERTLLNAYLVSLCEHGLTSPSTHGPRVAASVRSPFAATAISFIASAMGPYHFGALGLAMRELIELESSGEDIEAFIDRRASAGQRIWGYGHRFHKSTASPDPDDSRPRNELADPRVGALIALADELDWGGTHLRRVREIGRVLHRRKSIPINIDGLGAGILLDMGFAPDSAMLFVIIGRLPNIARLHAEEQQQTPNRFTALATRHDPGFDRTVERDQPSPY